MFARIKLRKNGVRSRSMQRGSGFEIHETCDSPNALKNMRVRDGDGYFGSGLSAGLTLELRVYFVFVLFRRAV